jgi:hypothetical protein
MDHKRPLAKVLIAAVSRQAGAGTYASTTSPPLRRFILSGVPEDMGKNRRKTKPESATILRGDSCGMKEGDRNAEVHILACRVSARNSAALVAATIVTYGLNDADPSVRGRNWDI